MQLEEVFERVKVPEASTIPDADAMKARTEKGDRAQWTIPNTEIRIARIESGARAGEYLFTAEPSAAPMNSTGAAAISRPKTGSTSTNSTRCHPAI